MKSKEKPRNSEESLGSGVFLIDTSVLIDHFRKSTHLDIWGNAISTITLLEFLRGVPGEERRAAFLKELKKLFKIEPLDDSIAKGYTLWTKNTLNVWKSLT